MDEIDSRDEYTLKIMLLTPKSELSRLIAEKWYLSLERLAEESGVPLKTIIRAVRGQKIRHDYEKKLRRVLDKL